MEPVPLGFSCQSMSVLRPLHGLSLTPTHAFNVALALFRPAPSPVHEHLPHMSTSTFPKFTQGQRKAPIASDRFAAKPRPPPAAKLPEHKLSIHAVFMRSHKQQSQTTDPEEAQHDKRQPSPLMHYNSKSQDDGILRL